MQERARSTAGDRTWFALWLCVGVACGLAWPSSDGGRATGAYAQPVDERADRRSPAPTEPARPTAPPTRTSAPDLERAREVYLRLVGEPVPWDDDRVRHDSEAILRAAAQEVDGFVDVFVECDSYPCVGLLLTERPTDDLPGLASHGLRLEHRGMSAVDAQGRRLWYTAIEQVADDVHAADASAWGRGLALLASHFPPDPWHVGPDDPEAFRPWGPIP